MGPTNRKRRAPSAEASDALTGNPNKPSLTSCLFGDTSTQREATPNASLFSSDMTFDSAIQQRLSENEHKASKLKTATEEKEPSQEVVGPREILALRKLHHSVSPLLEEITFHARASSRPCGVNGSASEDNAAVGAGSRYQEIVDILRSHGVVVLRDALPKRLLDEVALKAKELREELCSALDSRKIEWQTKEFRFHEIASRCPGRIDMRYGTERAPFGRFLISLETHVTPIINTILGAETARDDSHLPKLLYTGLIYSLPGSEDQPWHQDGMPLFTELDDASNLPPYAINVFLPVTDADATVEAGPTEFVPQSHRLPEKLVMEVARSTPELVSDMKKGNLKSTVSMEINDDEDSVETGVVGPVLTQGDVLLYDYRVCHRGTSNLTSSDTSDNNAGRVRSMLYLMFARPWFKEHLNFGSERLMNKSDQ